MSRLQVIAVEDRKHQGALPHWAEAMGAYMARVSSAVRDEEATTCEAIGRQAFSGRIEAGAVGELGLSRLVATPLYHSRRLLTTSPTIPTPVMLYFLVSGSARFAQEGRSCTLNPGDWCVGDMLRPCESWLHGSGTELLAVTMGQPTDPELRRLLEQGLAHRLDGNTGMSRILQSTAAETLGQMNRLPALSGGTLQRAISSMAWDALREQLEAPPRLRHQDLQRARLKRYIESKIADPALSVESIAEGCDMSVRSVHRAFDADPAGSVSRYIWLRRLSHCAATLRDPGQAHRPITDICFEWGFNSTSHFSRLFKDRFGVPPRDYRPAPSSDAKPLEI